MKHSKKGGGENKGSGWVLRDFGDLKKRHDVWRMGLYGGMGGCGCVGRAILDGCSKMRESCKRLDQRRALTDQRHSTSFHIDPNRI